MPPFCSLDGLAARANPRDSCFPDNVFPTDSSLLKNVKEKQSWVLTLFRSNASPLFILLTNGSCPIATVPGLFQGVTPLHDSATRCVKQKRE